MLTEIYPKGNTKKVYPIYAYGNITVAYRVCQELHGSSF